VILLPGWTWYREVERDNLRFPVPPACTAPAGTSFAAKDPQATGTSGSRPKEWQTPATAKNECWGYALFNRAVRFGPT